MAFNLFIDINLINMKTHTLLGSIILVGGLLSCQGKPQLEWVASTETACWQTEEPLPVAEASVEPLVSIKTTDMQQQIEGFGACFNELGWMSLNKLEPADREGYSKNCFIPTSEPTSPSLVCR